MKGGFRVWGIGFRVWGLGFRVWGLGFRGSLRPLFPLKLIEYGVGCPKPYAPYSIYLRGTIGLEISYLGLAKA